MEIDDWPNLVEMFFAKAAERGERPFLWEKIDGAYRPTLWSETQGLPQTFGTGTAGSGGLAPRASAWQPGYVGNPRLVIGVEQAPPGTLTFLVTDLFANTTPTILLGHNVYVAQSPALITAGIGLTLGSGPAGGYLSLPIAVPNDPGLAGATLFGQWLVVDPAGPFGFASSDAFGVSLF